MPICGDGGRNSKDFQSHRLSDLANNRNLQPGSQDRQKTRQRHLCTTCKVWPLTTPNFDRRMLWLGRTFPH
jgi:hypothetical protein